MSVVSVDRTLTLRAAENEIVHPHVDKAIVVEIAADLGTHNPSHDQADAAMAKIFLSDKDDLVSLIPDYWKPCVQGGLTGKDASCHFAPEMLSIPGLGAIEMEKDASVIDTGSERKISPSEQFHVGHGVSAPKLMAHREPEYSELARRMKYQGTVVLGLVVNQDGVPSNIHVIRPLGCGLDAQAVQAVGGWRFKPAEKDERPVPVVISVEVSFHVR
jgi:TonB family protein